MRKKDNRPDIISIALDKSHFSMDDLLKDSSYDDMLEIDLLKDELKLFHHVDGKYYTPFFDGAYSSLFDFTIHNIVHPDDVVIYKELMDPIILQKRLQEKSAHSFERAELRYKLQDGSYRWVEQFILWGKDNNVREGVIRLYIVDIHNRKMREQGSTLNESFNSQERNGLTRLHNEKSFFTLSTTKVNNNPDVNWCFISIDIEHFRLFDEWYGREAGDYLVAHIGIIISEIEEKYDAVGGYFGQDDFAIMMPYDEVVVNKIFEDIRSFTISFGSSVGFMPAFGVCFIKDVDNIMEMYNHASAACFYAKSDIKKRIYIYDNNMQSKSEQEYHILINFIDALKKNEITFFLQPQYRISTKKIVGAESLARWISNGKMISPAEFVPVLEKYGFITDLDKYIWEEVCKELRKWIDEGKKPVPISVNVSQVDIFTIDITAHFNMLIRKYRLDASLLKIEITESAYAEESNEVREVVRKLRALGLTVIMDDFGSGYSSLNMLSNINIDVIKLDAKFLNIDKGSQKGIHILESIISMTKVIGVPIVVEGVETKEQCDFLEGLGCRYVQGYYFSRPMPLDDFKKLIEDSSVIDERGFVVKKNQQISIREFLDQNIYSDSMLNNIIGAVAFYSWHGKDVDIVRFNQQFYESVNVPDFDEKLRSIQTLLPEEDKPKIYNVLQQAIEKRLVGAREILRFERVDGTYSWFMIHFYYLGEQGEEKMFYGSANNITDFAELQNRTNLIAKYSSDCIIFLSIINNKWIYKIASLGFEKDLGITREEFEEELNSGRIKERLEPHTAQAFRDIVVTSYKEMNSITYNFRMKNKVGVFVDLQMVINPVDDEVSKVTHIVSVHLRA